MTDTDNDRYLTAEQAADVLGTSPRTVHRYAEAGRIRSRKSSRRVMFNETDVQRIAEDLKAQRTTPDPDELRQLQEQLKGANYRIGYLEAQLAQRLLPDAQRQMEAELTKVWAERDVLEKQLKQATAPWRTWVLIGLAIVAAVLATLLITLFVLR